MSGTAGSGPGTRGTDLRPRSSPSLASRAGPAHVGADPCLRCGCASPRPDAEPPGRPRSRRSCWCTHPSSSTRRSEPGSGDDGSWARFGYGPGDNPIFDQMHEAGAIVAGATVRRRERCSRVRSRTRSTPRADCTTRCRLVRPGSACTTTRRSRSRGCLSQGVERVAYVDVDVHHGDGPQAIF